MSRGRPRHRRTVPADVELHRGDPEVEQDPVRGLQAQLLEDSRYLVVHRVHECRTALERSQPDTGQLQGVRIAVDPNGPGRGAAVEDGLGAPAEAEGGVDEDRAGSLSAGATNSTTRSRRTGTWRERVIVQALVAEPDHDGEENRHHRGGQPGEHHHGDRVTRVVPDASCRCDRACGHRIRPPGAVCGAGTAGTAALRCAVVQPVIAGPGSPSAPTPEEEATHLTPGKVRQRKSLGQERT